MKTDKKGQIGTEEIIVFAIVIIVLIIGGLFLFRSNIDAWMKNLPGFKGPGEEDRTIDTDLPASFDCKYPLGYISQDKKVHLINTEDLEKTEKKTSEEILLTFDPKNKELLFGTVIAKINMREEEGRLQSIGDIKLTREGQDFLENLEHNIIGTAKIQEDYQSKLRDTLNKIQDATFYSGAKEIGLICGKEKIIENIINQKECIEKCVYFGGECYDLSQDNKISIGRIDCENNKQCYIQIGEKLNDGQMNLNSISIETEPLLFHISTEGENQPSSQETFTFIPEQVYSLKISGEFAEPPCQSLRINSREFESKLLLEGEKEITRNIQIKEDEKILSLAFFEPTSKKFVYKNIELTKNSLDPKTYLREVTNLRTIVQNMKVKDKILFDLTDFYRSEDYQLEKYVPKNLPIFEIEKINEYSIRIRTFQEIEKRGKITTRNIDLGCTFDANSNLPWPRKVLTWRRLSLGAVENSLLETIGTCLGD